MKHDKFVMFPLLSLLILALPACRTSSVSIIPSPTPVPIIEATTTPTPSPIVDPTTTSHPNPIAVPQAEEVLLSNGFVHRADLDGVDICRVEGCKVYESTLDGINAWTYLDSSLYLTINSSDQYDATSQEATLTHVITQLFGEGVNTWVFDHLPAAVSANQEGSVNGYNISIGFVEAMGNKLTMIVISPKA